MENTTVTDLRNVIKLIRGNKLLLPDFQRGFVWSVDMQKRLVASVLVKMPIGSILILEAGADDYGCRVLGRKDQVNLSEKNKNGELHVLLDGQQRLTVLTNIFSNQLYYDYEGSGKLICDYKKIISTDLIKRFFITIPSMEKWDEKKDIFHLKKLKFVLDNPEDDVPLTFLAGDIRDLIVVEAFDENSTEVYVPHTENPLGICKYCMKQDMYYIPLYLLINDEEDDKNEKRLWTILRDMVRETVRYRVETEYEHLESEEEKKNYIERNIDSDRWVKIIEEGKFSSDILCEEWIQQGEQEWADKMKRYLYSCITKLDLHQIVVKKSDRNRAIDIYENLNLGGITLSTFELILAKAAKNKLLTDKNLYDSIVDYILQSKNYQESGILPESMENCFATFIEREKQYSASESLLTFDEKKNQLNGKYTEAFLNILSLISNAPDYQVDKIDVSLIKREKILDLSADNICQNYHKVCVGLDRACFFLQARCGIRKLQELNYNLMLVLLGYILCDDNNYKNKEVSKLLESWYWISIFSGHYDKDQNQHIIDDIKDTLNSIKNGDRKWLIEMKTKVFNMPGFSDEETLLLKTRVTPKKVIRKTICQFYLSKNCKDLLEEENINTFSENADTLEEHHIVPIGVLKGRTYKQMEKKEKEKNLSVFNSPLNFAMILKKTNRKISNAPLDYYIQQCNAASIYEFKISTEKDILSEEDVREFLQKRYQSTKGALEERIKPYL